MQGQAQPPGSGVDSIPPGTGDGMGGGVEATPQAGGSECNRDSTMMGGEGRAKKVESQVKRPRGHPGAPWAGSSLQLVRCWESPSPIPVQRQRLEVVKSGSLVCKSFVSIHCPGQPTASLGLCASAPWGKEKAALPATSVCPGHPKGACVWALWSLKLEEVGWRGGGIRGTCPQAGRGRGGVLRTGEGGQ